MRDHHGEWVCIGWDKCAMKGPRAHLLVGSIVGPLLGTPQLLVVLFVLILLSRILVFPLLQLQLGTQPLLLPFDCRLQSAGCWVAFCMGP